MLREQGDDPMDVLSKPEGLMRWYIANEFVERKEDAQMLTLAYDMGACAVLVDGIDEAAGTPTTQLPALAGCVGVGCTSATPDRA